MNTHSTTEVINQDRRRLLSTVAMGLAVASTASVPAQLSSADEELTIPDSH